MRLRFDRGTVVLDGAGAGVERLGLPGIAWDPRVGRWRAPARQHAALVARLADAGVRFSDDVRPADGAPAWRLPPLRWYQEAALAAWAAAGRRGVVALPTGAGKTTLALAALASSARAALCLVPTRVLLEQWAAAVAQATGAPPGQLGDGERRLGPVTVATYASAVTWAPRIGDRFGTVVVDEAHHVGATCPREVLDMLVAPARLGLSATPVEGAAAAEVEAGLGPLVYALGIEALAGAALAPYDLVEVPVRLTPEERARHRALRATFAAAYAGFQRVSPGATWAAFVAAAARSPAGREALEAWRAARRLLAYPAGKRLALRALLARHPGARTLVFTADNETAYAIARELLVVPITHEIGRAERAEVLARFDAGEAPVLVSAQVLDEGLDVPRAEVAIVAGGSGDGRRHVQRVGRVLRAHEGKRARIYELTVSGTAEVGLARRRRAALGGAPGWP